MQKDLKDMSLEELWQLFPIFLTEHKAYWKDWYNIEKSNITSIIGRKYNIYHIGSTAIDFIWAKPIIDILICPNNYNDMLHIATILSNNGYTIMCKNNTRISLNKGYTINGFDEKVFHIHIDLTGNKNEVYFMEYLNANPLIAKKYQDLKLELWKKFEHNRDAYTDAKSEFISLYTSIAKKEISLVE